MLDLLSARVPVTLLLDLLDPAGPESRLILRREPPDDLSWLAPRPA